MQSEIPPPFNYQERTIEINGLPVHLFQGGEGPPLLWLHGVAPAGEWLPLYSLLARHFTIYVPDHPGFGQTERPAWLEGMDDLVLHYEELLRALHLERPAVAGFSFGGWLAAEFAVTYPERIGALVLLNAAGLHVEGALIPDLPALSGQALAETVFHDQSAARAYFAERQNRRVRLQSYRGMSTLALLAWNPWFNPRLERRLRRITAPTLALWAEHDRLVPPVYGETYRAGIPDCRLEILPDCGHMAPVERPEAVAAAVTRFLTSAPATAGPEA